MMTIHWMGMIAIVGRNIWQGGVVCFFLWLFFFATAQEAEASVAEVRERHGPGLFPVCLLAKVGLKGFCVCKARVCQELLGLLT